MGKARYRASPKVVQHVNRNLEDLVLRELCHLLKRSKNPFNESEKGRPPHEAPLVVFCCIWKIMFCHTYDSIESAVKSREKELCKAFGVDRVPGHSVIQRGMKQLPMSYIRMIIRSLTFRYRRKGIVAAVDSSGFSLSNSSKWYDIRIKRENTRKESLKLHIVIDVETGIIMDFMTTNWKAADCKQFGRLINALPKIAKALADKAYSSRENCTVVHERGGEPYIKFKENATGKAKGSPAWKISFRKYKSDEDAWNEVYHQRSRVESVFSSIKKRWHSHIASRTTWMQRKELALKVFAYNLKQVLYNRRAEELGRSLWQKVE